MWKESLLNDLDVTMALKNFICSYRVTSIFRVLFAIEFDLYTVRGESILCGYAFAGCVLCILYVGVCVLDVYCAFCMWVFVCGNCCGI